VLALALALALARVPPRVMLPRPRLPMATRLSRHPMVLLPLLTVPRR